MSNIRCTYTPLFLETPNRAAGASAPSQTTLSSADAVVARKDMGVTAAELLRQQQEAAARLHQDQGAGGVLAGKGKGKLVEGNGKKGGYALGKKLRVELLRLWVTCVCSVICPATMGRTKYH